MGLFDRLQQGVVKGLSQTERALELSRLKSQIELVGRQRDEAIMGLGRAVYRTHRENRLSHPELGSAIEQIREMEVALGRLEGQVEALRQQSQGHLCSSCGALSASDAKFCIGCGRAVERVETRPCPACGGVIGLDVSFCGRCGTDVGRGVELHEPDTDQDAGSAQGETDAAPATVSDGATSGEPVRGVACTSCGHHGEPGERFCGSCGSALVS